MNNYINYKNQIEDILYKKGLYEIQKHTVKKEMYIEKLLLEDYMKTIKNSITSRYDLISDIFKYAWEEQNKKLKKDRTHYESLKGFIMEDFLENNNKFKIKEIIKCGPYEPYGWSVWVEGYGTLISIFIPDKRNIDFGNIKIANYGMIVIETKINESGWKNIISTYKVEEAADAISKYFANKTFF